VRLTALCNGALNGLQWIRRCLVDGRFPGWQSCESAHRTDTNVHERHV